MKSNREMRAEAREMLKNGWFGRVALVSIVLYAIMLGASLVVMSAFSDMNVQTWWDFMREKAKAAQAGLGYTVPSSSIAWSMTGATAFQQLVGYLFSAIFIFGVSMVFLKASRKDDNRWLEDSMGGFKRPLQLFYLILLMNVRVFLWSLLFFFPGIVAIYRYRMAWYLKSDHPDWGASKCLDESGRMMRGMKAQMFCLDMHLFFRLILIGMLVGMIEGSAAVVGEMLPLAGFAKKIALFFALWLTVVSLVRYFAARTLFYKELADSRPQGGADDLAGDDR